jgi:serine/threonine protein kinase
MPDEPSAGLVLNDRYELTERLGSGYSGTVWKALDIRTGAIVVVKSFREDVDDLHASYAEYLTNIACSFRSESFLHSLLPTEITKADGYVFQILPFVEGAYPVNLIIPERGIHPALAMEIVSGIATALMELHDHSLIHADLKPSNILIVGSPLEIRLIDFGMVRKAESTGAIQLLGTYSYLPPTLTDDRLRTSNSATAPLGLSEEVIGSFIDIYSLGVVALELLTGKADRIPSPTEHEIHQRISGRNPWMNAIPRSLQERIVNLIFQLLSISASRPGITAASAATLARHLAAEIGQGPHDGAPSIIRPPDSGVENRELTYPSFVSAQINFIKNEIAERTTILRVAPNEPAALANPRRNEEIFSQLNNVFADARRRTQTSWRLSILMTWASFAVIVLLIVVAVTGSLVTGEKLWAVIFGGLGASSLLGTLIWKPYDRLFRATILAQQIEVVHIRVTTGMHGTLEIGEQLKILNEANNALRTIFRDHSQGTRRN